MNATVHPEQPLLEAVLGEEAAQRISVAAGDWRTLTVHELVEVGLDEQQTRAIGALQALARRSYSPVGPTLGCADEVGRVYVERLAALEYEVILAVAVDGRNRLLHEIEVARGGLHGAAIRPSDVYRPLIRAGASAFILVHNHPSGDPYPSPEDRAMTAALVQLGHVVDLPLLDHVIVGGRGGGYESMHELGMLEREEPIDEEGDSDEAIRS